MELGSLPLIQHIQSMLVIWLSADLTGPNATHASDPCISIYIYIYIYITPFPTHWGDVFLALTDRYMIHWKSVIAVLK